MAQRGSEACHVGSLSSRFSSSLLWDRVPRGRTKVCGTIPPTAWPENESLAWRAWSPKAACEGSPR